MPVQSPRLRDVMPFTISLLLSARAAVVSGSPPFRLVGSGRPPRTPLGRLFLHWPTGGDDDDVHVSRQDGNAGAVAPSGGQLVLQRELEVDGLRLPRLQLDLAAADRHLDTAQAALLLADDREHRHDERFEVTLLTSGKRLDRDATGLAGRNIVAQDRRPRIGQRERHVPFVGDDHTLRLRDTRAVDHDEHVRSDGQVEHLCDVEHHRLRPPAEIELGGVLAGRRRRIDGDGDRHALALIRPEHDGIESLARRGEAQCSGRISEAGLAQHDLGLARIVNVDAGGQLIRRAGEHHGLVL